MTLGILARYWNYMGYNKKEICNLLNSFMIANYKGYNPVKWDLTIDKLASKASKYPLIQIDYICITKHELNTIQSINGKPLQRIAFTLLCLAKFYNAVNDKNNNWVNSKINNIFKMAKVQASKTNKPLMINDLKNLGLIKYSAKVDNININVRFINNESEVILQIKDFRDLGYEYALYCGEKFVRCLDCERLTRSNKTKKRCKECQEQADKQRYIKYNQKRK